MRCYCCLQHKHGVTVADACCPLQVRCIDLQEPQGWVVVPLPPDDNPE